MASTSLFELKQEIESMRKSLRLKDDTIGFLQKEKEKLIREVSESWTWRCEY